MEFGVHLPDAGRDPSRDAMIRIATAAEELGYSSVRSSDHIAWPDPATLQSKYPYADDNSGFPEAGSAWLDCIGTLQFVAGITERVLLGTTVLILGYRALCNGQRLGDLGSILTVEPSWVSVLDGCRKSLKQ